MEPFRFNENLKVLNTYEPQLKGDPDLIRIFCMLEDISRSLALIADLMINEENRRRAEANKEETEKLIKSMDSINKAREGKE